MVLECVPHAKDLGYILHYRRRQFRTPQKERHAKALKTLRKLPKSQHDLHTKALIAQTAVVKTLYGAHCHVAGEQYTRELRTEIANGLVGLRKNVNPFLACSMLSRLVTDPEVYLIQQSLRFAREFLLYSDDDTRRIFLNFAATTKHRPQNVTGPSGALALYVARLGWQITQQGQLLVSAFFQLDLLYSPWEDIVQALEHSWMEHVAIQLTSRKGYRGLPVPDRQATLRLFKQLPDKILTIASYAVTGGYMLQHQKTKFDADATDFCHYCEGAIDTHQHRVLECPLTQHVRQQFPETCQFFQEHDPVLVTCPILFLEAEWELHRQIWYSLPDPEMHLPPFALDQQVFTDGTCQFPDQPQYRHAANAAVCRMPNCPPLDALLQLPVEQQLNQGFHVISVGLLPGKQTIARAELHIVVCLAEAGHPGPYVTDSQYVINTYRLLQQQPDWRTLHTKPNFDLLWRWHCTIWQKEHRPNLIKVKSHVKPTTHTLAEDQLLQIGNAVADEAAKQALRNLSKSHHEALTKQLQEQRYHAAMLRQQFQMRFDMALVCIHFDKPEVVVTNAGDPTKFLRQMQQWTVDPAAVRYSIEDIPEEAIHASRWGSRFTDALLQWLATLAWPPPDMSNPPLGISWIELIFNFLLTSQLEIPVNTAPYKKESRYLTSSEGLFTIDQYDFSHTIMSFQRAIEHVQFLSSRELAPKTGQIKTGSLYYMGGGSFRNGFRARPSMPLQKETLEWLWQYMTDHRNEDRVQFEVTPQAPSREPLFSYRYQDPVGLTPQDRAKRYARWRVHIKTLRDGGA